MGSRSNMFKHDWTMKTASLVMSILNHENDLNRANHKIIAISFVSQEAILSW